MTWSLDNSLKYDVVWWAEKLKLGLMVTGAIWPSGFGHMAVLCFFRSMAFKRKVWVTSTSLKKRPQKLPPASQ